VVAASLMHLPALPAVTATKRGMRCAPLPEHSSHVPLRLCARSHGHGAHDAKGLRPRTAPHMPLRPCSPAVTAMKRSIVDYVTASGVERGRLDLAPLEPLLALPSPTQQSWRAVVDRHLPPTWHTDVEVRRLAAVGGGWYGIGGGRIGVGAGLTVHVCAWHACVQVAREEVAWTLQTLSANALELSRLWHSSRFSSALLVGLVCSPLAAGMAAG
jgi:hypothetical protein